MNCIFYEFSQKRKNRSLEGGGFFFRNSKNHLETGNNAYVNSVKTAYYEMRDGEEKTIITSSSSVNLTQEFEKG